jgi:hypothetical protein
MRCGKTEWKLGYADQPNENDNFRTILPFVYCCLAGCLEFFLPQGGKYIHYTTVAMTLRLLRATVLIHANYLVGR